MNVRSMTSAVVFAATVTLCLGGAPATVEAQDAARAPRNLEEFDAMFRELGHLGLGHGLVRQKVQGFPRRLVR